MSWELASSGLAPLEQQWDAAWPVAGRRALLTSLLRHCLAATTAGRGLLRALITRGSAGAPVEGVLLSREED